MPSVSLVGTAKIQAVITNGLKLVSCLVIVRAFSRGGFWDGCFTGDFTIGYDMGVV